MSNPRFNIFICKAASEPNDPQNITAAPTCYAGNNADGCFILLTGGCAVEPHSPLLWASGDHTNKKRRFTLSLLSLHSAPHPPPPTTRTHTHAHARARTSTTCTMLVVVRLTRPTWPHFSVKFEHFLCTARGPRLFNCTARGPCCDPPSLGGHSHLTCHDRDQPTPAQCT